MTAVYRLCFSWAIASLALFSSACGMQQRLSNPLAVPGLLPQTPLPHKARLADAPRNRSDAAASWAQSAAAHRHAVALPYFSFSRRAARDSDSQ